jgi:uncharacterized protein YxeA
MKKIVLFVLVAVLVCAVASVLAESSQKVDSSDSYVKPARTTVAAAPVAAAQPTVENLVKKFAGVDNNSVTNLGPVKKGASLSFTPGSLANYYLFVFVNGQWVAYKIADGATSINIPVDSSAAFIGGSNTPLAGALAL